MNDLEYSILKCEAGNKTESALSVSVIYGANAGGKTSVINAMSCMRQIVLRGNINDMEDDRSMDHVSHHMSMVPFAFSDEQKPVSFEVTFVYHGVKYCYGFSAFLGEFLQKKAERYIDREQLFVNDKIIFERSRDAVNKLSLKPMESFLNVGYSVADANKTKESMSSNIAEDTLLLTSDFSSFCSKKLVVEIKNWFKDQFFVINSADRARFTPNVLGEPGTENQALIEKNINRIAKEAGIVGTDLAYMQDAETHTVKIVSVISKNAGSSYGYGVDSDQIESVGTLRLVSIMPAIITAMKSGAVLVMDELDASLHPDIVMSLISVFHNDSVNKNGAQLIFNTHNVVYLNSRLLRRDEIKFVERDSETKSSSLYALSDFKANGKENVRKTSDYMRNYLMNRYGAMPDSDLTDIFADIMRGGAESENV
ncbi:MAG: ATP-binding protein [Lachnospiraceae bacterium]|nr:ATP-binding protein [Lachnospiraceae bacterium]